MLILSVAGLARPGGSSTGAEITASLEVAADQGIHGGAYYRAELTVTNSAASAVETVLLKPAGVGLTVRYKLTVPPGSDGKQLIFLPAISPAQEYAITALDASGEVVGRTSASITWPAELVATDAFIDDSFKPWADEPARWPAKRRRNHLLVLAMFVTAAAAVLFIRWSLLRTVTIAVIVAGTAALIAYVFIPTGPDVVQEYCYELDLHDGAGGLKSDSFVVLSAMRTTRWSHKIFGHPVYPDRAAAANDGTLADAATGIIHLTLRPGRVRIIRPAGWNYPSATTSPWRGSVRRETDGFAIEADFVRQGWLVIRDDSVWRIGSVSVKRKVSIRTDRAQSYWAFLSGEGGGGLNRHARRLLSYWRNKHQQGGKVYLMELGGDEDGAHIEVVRLVEMPSERTTTSTAKQQIRNSKSETNSKPEIQMSQTVTSKPD